MEPITLNYDETLRIKTKLTCSQVKNVLKIGDEIAYLGKYGEENLDASGALAINELNSRLSKIQNQKKYAIYDIFGIIVNDDKVTENAFKQIIERINETFTKYTKSVPSNSKSEISYEYSMLNIYDKCAKAYKWSLQQIDETDIETLIDFIYFDETKNPNIKTIKGKKYKKAAGIPKFLL